VATWLFSGAHLEQLRRSRTSIVISRSVSSRSRRLSWRSSIQVAAAARPIVWAWRQLCTLPWLGSFVPDDRTGTLNGHHAPEAAALANIDYARCSTLAQDLTAQRQALAALGVPGDRGCLTRA
jgi:hypothetical protein